VSERNNSWVVFDTDYSYLLEQSIRREEVKKMEGELVKSASGATSTKLDESWSLIPFAALQAIARRFWVGAQKHTPRNWEKAIEAKDEAFAEKRLDHLCRHVALFAEFHRQEDLDAIGCNFAMLAHFKANGLLADRGSK